MYLRFFDLDELPFSLTPDPRFLFMSQNHIEAVEHLEFGIKQRQGFIVLTGDLGTGKTTVCKMLLSKLDDTVKSALVLNPMLSPLELLQTINEDLGLESDDNSTKRLVRILNKFLIEQYAAGGNVVVILDEAQRLSDECLEQLRLLSNLETAKEKLIQIVLVGQPELARMLTSAVLAPLAERVAVRYHIGPLSYSESCRYVAHRLSVAGCDKELFAKSALRRVFRYSGGIPRRINLICDKSLLCAYGMGERVVRGMHVRRAYSEIKAFRRVGHSARTRILVRRWGSVVAAVVAVFLVVWSIGPGGSVRVGPKPGSGIRGGAGKSVGESSIAPEPSGIGALRGVSGFDENGVFRVQQEKLCSFGAVVTLFRLWNEDIRGLLSDEDGLTAPEGSQVWATIRRAGFRIEARRATLGDVRTLDVPCLVLLRRNQSKVPRYCALVGLRGETFYVADPIDGLVEMGESVLDRRWTRRAIYVLPDLEGLSRTLRLGSRGSDVRAFKGRLFHLGLLGAGVSSSRYDRRCAQAVRMFQVANGLEADGIAGWRTRIALCRELMTTKAPRLSRWASNGRLVK